MIGKEEELINREMNDDIAKERFTTYDNNIPPVSDEEVNAGDVLARLSKFFHTKNVGYGPTYLSKGKLMTALFPHGVNLETQGDFNRYAILDTVIMKLQRYSQQFLDGGHLDSLHDAIIYLAMLAEIDENKKSGTSPSWDKWPRGTSGERRNASDSSRVSHKVSRGVEGVDIDADPDSVEIMADENATITTKVDIAVDPSPSLRYPYNPTYPHLANSL